MERRHFLKLTLGFTAGAAVLAAGAEAAPLPPVTPVTPEGQGLAPRLGQAEPAIVSQDDVDGLVPDRVRWRRHWGHRRWGFWGHRRRHWRRRYWGWPGFPWPWRHRHWGWHRHWHPWRF